MLGKISLARKKKNRKDLSGMSPTDNYGDSPYQLTCEERGIIKHLTPSPTAPADNPGGARHQSSVHFRLNVPGFLDGVISVFST